VKLSKLWRSTNLITVTRYYTCLSPITPTITTFIRTHVDVYFSNCDASSIAVSLYKTRILLSNLVFYGLIPPGK